MIRGNSWIEDRPEPKDCCPLERQCNVPEYRPLTKKEIDKMMKNFVLYLLMKNRIGVGNCITPHQRWLACKRGGKL